jgi:hypothetical protein
MVGPSPILRESERLFIKKKKKRESEAPYDDDSQPREHADPPLSSSHLSHTDLDPEGPLRFTPVLLPALTYWHTSSTSIKTSKKVYWCPPHPHPWMTWRRLPASRFPPPSLPVPSRFHQPSRLSSMGNNHRFITRDLTPITVMSPPLAMSIIRRISNNLLGNSSRGWGDCCLRCP